MGTNKSLYGWTVVEKIDMATLYVTGGSIVEVREDEYPGDSD